MHSYGWLPLLCLHDGPFLCAVLCDVLRAYGCERRKSSRLLACFCAAFYTVWPAARGRRALLGGRAGSSSSSSGQASGSPARPPACLPAGAHGQQSSLLSSSKLQPEALSPAGLPRSQSAGSGASSAAGGRPPAAQSKLRFAQGQRPKALTLCPVSPLLLCCCFLVSG